ncbi:hypothetical protein SEPCBS119000_006487 [Sporothrix epigloea]|uniref:Uncharacterized protein n=1 Tax=Sporothrix epigloea TaxID=1892477 RepID=A0ABP0E396_9PEZI
MDLPYSQQQQARQKCRSAADLQYLTLAPFMSRMPLQEDLNDNDISKAHTYPPNTAARGSTGSQTPGGIDSGSNNRTSALSKSLSATHLPRAADDLFAQQHRRRKTANHDHDGGRDDWLFRAAVLMTNESRESKGQTWLAARASSTSLNGLRSTDKDGDEAIIEHGLARTEGDSLGRLPNNSCHSSRRGSLDQDRTNFLVQPCRRINSAAASRSGSRMNSRANSRIGSRVQLFTPNDVRQHSLEFNGNKNAIELLPETSEYRESALFVEEENAGYGPGGLMASVGPDFVNLEGKFEAMGQYERLESFEDEDQIRRLMNHGKAEGIVGSWLNSVFGWSLSDVQETEGEVEAEDEGKTIRYVENDGGSDHSLDSDIGANINGEAYVAVSQGGKQRRSDKRVVAVNCGRRNAARATSRRRFEGDDGSAAKDVPPPPLNDEGIWRDVAWLLSVASKVIS